MSVVIFPMGLRVASGRDTYELRIERDDRKAQTGPISHLYDQLCVSIA